VVYFIVFEKLNIEDNIFDAYNTFDIFKLDYRNYKLLHSCHWLNKYFGLELARLVLPNIKWMVRTSNKHTTIVSTCHNYIFDILYFDELDNFDILLDVL
jgi:hypothetical protein